MFSKNKTKKPVTVKIADVPVIMQLEDLVCEAASSEFEQESQPASILSLPASD